LYQTISAEAMPNEPSETLSRNRRYVAYYRMSTGRQDQPALGFDAQRADVSTYISTHPGQLIAEFSETMSGRKNNRPKLDRALYLCKLFRAVLVVAHLDRLARNVYMITRLMESRVEFVAVDFPHADKFTLHVLAALAEYESQLISDRMKAVYASARERGEKSERRNRNPNPRLGPRANEISARNRRARIEARARDLGPLIWKAKAEGKTNRLIAEEFNQTGVRPRGKKPWTALSIWLIAKQSYPEFGVPTLPAPPYVRKRMLALLEEVSPRLVEWRRQGMTFTAMASELNASGCPAPRGKLWWTTSVRRYFYRKSSETPARRRKEAAWANNL
jgi:DNA invertase Pin-like site-specific DNA recombinase